jgi:hypothetical protein
MLLGADDGMLLGADDGMLLGADDGMLLGADGGMLLDTADSQTTQGWLLQHELSRDRCIKRIKRSTQST